MGFSYISAANDDEYFERYGIAAKLGRKFYKTLVQYMPDYIECTVSDMGVGPDKISGFTIGIPPVNGNERILKKKLVSAMRLSKRLGAGAVVVDPSIGIEFKDEIGLKISRGLLFSPSAIIDGARSVSWLLGMDFIRSNICIADAATEIGLAASQLLLNDVLYLTLCTQDRDKLMESLNRYIIKTGFFPAIVRNFRKAAASCDILIYTGGADIGELSACIRKKAIIVNLTPSRILIKRDLPLIDDVILEGVKEPEFIGRRVEFTSRIWEGALLTLCDIDTSCFCTENAETMRKLAGGLGIKLKNVVANGRHLDRESIYRYR